MGRLSGVLASIATDVDNRTLTITVDSNKGTQVIVADINDVTVYLDGVAGDMDDLTASDFVTIPSLPCTVINARAA